MNLALFTGVVRVAQVKDHIAAVKRGDSLRNGRGAVETGSPIGEDGDAGIVGDGLGYRRRIDPGGFRRLEDQLGQHTQPAGDIDVVELHRQHPGGEAVALRCLDGLRRLKCADLPSGCRLRDE